MHKLSPFSEVLQRQTCAKATGTKANIRDVLEAFEGFEVPRGESGSREFFFFPGSNEIGKSAHRK
jgi:hypothetical protein